jgi:hypothetical protein
MRLAVAIGFAALQAILATTSLARTSVVHHRSAPAASSADSVNRGSWRVSYAGFWVMRRSGGAVCRHFDDLDAVLESDTSDDFRQLICSVQAPPGF